MLRVRLRASVCICASRRQVERKYFLSGRVCTSMCVCVRHAFCSDLSFHFTFYFFSFNVFDGTYCLKGNALATVQSLRLDTRMLTRGAEI